MDSWCDWRCTPSPLLFSISCRFLLLSFSSFLLGYLIALGRPLRLCFILIEQSI